MGLSGLEHVVELRTLSSLLRRLSLCRFCRVHRFCRFCWLRCAKMSRLLACLQQTQSLVLHANLVSKGQHIYTHIYIYSAASLHPISLHHSAFEGSDGSAAPARAARGSRTFSVKCD